MKHYKKQNIIKFGRKKFKNRMLCSRKLISKLISKHRKYPKTWRKHYMKDGETLGEMEGNM